jgi:hypothetical protein
VDKGENLGPPHLFQSAGENHVHAVDKGENLSPPHLFQSAGENHVHAVDKGENLSPRTHATNGLK